LSNSNNTINNNINISQFDAKLHQSDAKVSQYAGRVRRAGDEHRTAPALGLSTCHNTRKIEKNKEKSGSITLYPDGSLVEVSKNRINPYAGKKRDWVRGKIKKFSKRSRSRLMRTLAKISKQVMPLFITLTYPAEYPENYEVYKADLDKFFKRLRYRFPEFACIWKLEFQQRGAPHYHLLVWGLSIHCKQLISKLWYEVVGSGDEKHLKAGTQVQKIRSWRGVMSYASKYMGKLETGEQGLSGRFWGVSGRGAIPWSAIEKYEVFPAQVVQAMRLMRRYAGLKSRDYSSLGVYVNDVSQWKRALLC